MKDIGLLMKSYEICANNQILYFFNDHCQEESIRSHVNAGDAIVFLVLEKPENIPWTYLINSDEKEARRKDKML